MCFDKNYLCNSNRYYYKKLIYNKKVTIIIAKKLQKIYNLIHKLQKNYRNGDLNG